MAMFTIAGKSITLPAGEISPKATTRDQPPEHDRLHPYKRGRNSNAVCSRHRPGQRQV